MMPANLKNLKVIDIKIHKPFFDPHPEKSTTNNHSWRVGLFVYFQDNFGRKFVWMPRWADLQQILDKKDEVEKQNKDLCRKSLADFLSK